MSSRDTTEAVISILGCVPEPFNPNDYNMSNGEDQEETQDLNADEEETQDNIEEENEEHDKFVDEGPQVGMMYETREHLRLAYKEFSRGKGFGVAIRNSRPDYVIFRCDRGRTGHEAKRSTKRVNCQARVIARTDKESGYWRVQKVELAHNHELDPDMSPFMSCHREITFGQKRKLEKTDISGVPFAHINFQRVSSHDERVSTHSRILSSGGYPHMTREYQLYREIEKKFEKCKELAFNKPARMELMKRRLDELAKELSELKCASDEHDSCSNDMETGTYIKVKNPKVTISNR